MKISIITVALNAESTIEDTLISVSSQTHPDVEHLVIDGGSTDGTLGVTGACGKHLAVLISEPDQGLYYAMNKGAKLSTGEVLGFLNADDFYARQDTLESIASVFQDESVDVCYGDLEYVERNDARIVLRHWKAGVFTPGKFATGWAPPHPTFFVRRSVFDSAGGFNTKYKLAADNELMMRILENLGRKSHYFPEVMVKMRIGGVTNKSFYNIIRGNQEILSALKCNGLKTNLFTYALHKIILKIDQHLAGVAKNRPMSL